MLRTLLIDSCIYISSCLFFGYVIRYNEYLLPIIIILSYLCFSIIYDLIDRNAPNYPKFILKDFLLCIINILIFSFCGYYLQKYMKHNTFNEISIMEHLYTIIFWITCLEVVFFTAHFLMHYIPFLYKNIHKVHHKYKITRPFYAQYNHIIETLITVLPSTYIIFAFMKCQWLISISLMIVFIKYNTGAHRCNQKSNERHAFHHKDGRYNLANFEYVDKIFGTLYRKKN